MKKLILFLCLLSSFSAFADESEEEPGNELQVGGSVVVGNNSAGSMLDIRKIEPHSGTCSRDFICVNDEKDIQGSIGVVRMSDGSYRIVGRGAFVSGEDPGKAVAPFAGSHDSVVANAKAISVSPWGFIPFIPTGVRVRPSRGQFIDAYVAPTTVNVDRESGDITGSSGVRAVAGQKFGADIELQEILGSDFFWDGKITMKSGLSFRWKPTKRTYVNADIVTDSVLYKSVAPNDHDMNVTATVGGGVSL